MINFLQYWNPSEAEGYRETTRAVRKLGRKCIQERIDAIRNGEEVPNDILSNILRITSELMMIVSISYPQHVISQALKCLTHCSHTTRC